MAAARFKEGNLPKAAQLIGLASDLDASLEPPGVMMAKWAALAGDMQASRQLLDKAVLAHPDDPEPYFLLADLARMEARRTEAMLLLGRGQELLEQFDGSPERKAKIEKSMWMNMAHFAEMQNKFDSALSCLEELEALAPSSAEPQRLIGGLYLRRGAAGDEKLALDAFEKAFQRDPEQLPPSAYLAQLYLRKGDVAKAEALLEEALQAHPEHFGTLALAANYHLGQGNLEKARGYADSLARLKPDSGAIHYLLGTLAFYRNDLGLAESEFRKALEKSPREPDLVNALAITLLEQKGDEKVAEALALAEANLRRASSQVTAATLAWALYRAGRFESCYRLVDQLLSRESLDSNGAYFAASILVHQGKPEEAAKLLEAALRSKAPFFKRADAEKLLASLGANMTTAGAR